MQPAKPPVISIIIPCRDEAVLIGRAMRSILGQSLREPIEVILVDDASVDGCAALAEAELVAWQRGGLSHPPMDLRVLRHDSARGNAGAFATGLQQVRGRYWHVLDGDDWWSDPDKLRVQLAILEAHPELVASSHRTIWRVAADGSEAVHPAHEPEGTLITWADLLDGDLHLHTSAVLFRNLFRDGASGAMVVPAIFQSVRGDTIRLLVQALEGPIHHLRQTMSVHDDHGGGTWTGLNWPGRRDLLRNMYQQLQEHQMLAPLGDAATRAFLAERLALLEAHAPLSLRPLGLGPRASPPRQRVVAVARVSSLLDLEMQLTELAQAGDLEAGLHLAHRFLVALQSQPDLARAFRMRRVTSLELDWHCAHLGGLVALRRGLLPEAAPPEQARKGPAVVLVSGLAPDAEGRWHDIRDLVEMLALRGRVVVVSTEMLASMPEALRALGPEVEVLLNTDPGLGEKVAWLVWYLSQVGPSRIFALPARTDVVMAAGLRRQHAPQIHRVASGFGGLQLLARHWALDGHLVRRPHDAAWFARHGAGREILHLPGVVATGDGALADARPVEGLVTATAGEVAASFEARHDFTFDQVLATLALGGVRRHLHLGPLSDGMRQRIHKALIRSGISPDFLDLRPWARDPGAMMRAEGVGLCLQGLPLPEIPVVLSALAEGVPVLAHDCVRDPALCLGDICPAGTPVWATLGDLATRLAELTPERLGRLSREARAFMAGRTPAAMAARRDFLHPLDMTMSGPVDAGVSLRALICELTEWSLPEPV